MFVAVAMHRSVKQNWKQLPSYSFGGLMEERRNSRVDPTKVTPPDDQDEGAKLMLGGAVAKGRKPPTTGHERGQRGILIPARQVWPARLPGAEILKATPKRSLPQRPKVLRSNHLGVLPKALQN